MQVITRKQAIELGRKTYFTGNPCIYGHVAYRSIKGVCIECKKKEYAKNREKILHKSKFYYEMNKERIKIRQKQYVKNNPEKRRALKQYRRARERHSDGKYTGSDICKLLIAQKSKCTICKISIKKKFHIDHIVPIALGGNNRIYNIQLLCPSCNIRKGAKHPVVFMKECGFLI